MADCALVGGETAEMPGFYPEDEYDLAGFVVGIVDKEKIINSENINVGDKVIGITSSGVHSNGFSLVRKVFDINKKNINDYKEELGKSLGSALLEPTKIYVKPVLKLLQEIDVKGISHITGGGFYENMPRMLKDNVSLIIHKNSYEIPEIFKLIQKEGDISQRDMYNTFNMGIGMALIVSPDNVQEAIKILEQEGEKAFEIGEVIKGNKEVIIKNN